jgi:hypothetical protein
VHKQAHYVMSSTDNAVYRQREGALTQEAQNEGGRVCTLCPGNSHIIGRVTGSVDDSLVIKAGVYHEGFHCCPNLKQCSRSSILRGRLYYPCVQ